MTVHGLRRGEHDFSCRTLRVFLSSSFHRQIRPTPPHPLRLRSPVPLELRNPLGFPCAGRRSLCAPPMGSRLSSTTQPTRKVRSAQKCAATRRPNPMGSDSAGVRKVSQPIEIARVAPAHRRRLGKLRAFCAVAGAKFGANRGLCSRASPKTASGVRMGARRHVCVTSSLVSMRAVRRVQMRHDEIITRRKFFEIKTREQRIVRALYSTLATGRLPVIHSAKHFCFDRTFGVLRTSHFSGFLRSFRLHLPPLVRRFGRFGQNVNRRFECA